MGAHVLVVEDEILVREMLVYALSDAGFDVDEAESGDEAAMLLDTDDYLLLLTDVRMPGRLDGIDLAAHARKLKPALPIVFFTGRPDTMRKLGRLPRRTAVLTKPCSMADVVNTIREVLADADGLAG